MEGFPDGTVKEEQLYYEDANDIILDYNFDVKLDKVEVESTYDDWVIGNGDISQTFANTISYDDLIEGCKQICFLCCNTFPSSFHLLQHNLIHFKVPLIKRKLFTCEHCPNYYTNIKDIEYHIDASHMPILRKSRIKKHSKFCKCIICKKKSNRSTHRRVEMDESLLFQCDNCDQRFKCKKYLSKHIKCSHEDSRKEFKCPICPAILYNRYALTTHKRNCHSKNKIKCNICDSVLKCQSYLYAHMRRVHYDDGVVHSCDICGKIFKSPRYLTIHKRNSHRRRKKT